MKYIFVSGGVVSGLGKGITAASLGLILKSKGIKVTNVKVDMYLNIDAGTIRPQEHGEVFVTDDGLETDQDLGNYERFTGQLLKRENYMTTGQVYREVIEKERQFAYEGEDVEAIPHVTDEIIRRWKLAGKKNKAEVVIVELGGTVGEYQNSLFFEASRILKFQQPEDVIQVHVTYMPVLKNVGELKSKPAQQSVKFLNAMGIQPDFIVVRSQTGIDEKRKEKLALFSNVKKENIIDASDLKSIYQVPLQLNKQKIGEKILEALGLKVRKTKLLLRWKKMLKRKSRTRVRVAMVGKYFTTGDYKLIDSYVSVVEAIKHASRKLRVRVVMDWITSDEVNDVDWKNYDGIIVPQGWGKRGIEGKLVAVRAAREKEIPFLGLCFGMQMAVIEFGRNILGLKSANTVECGEKEIEPVIHVMPDQEKYLKEKQYGGTIRLGAWPCLLKRKSKVWRIYKKYKKAVCFRGDDFSEKNTVWERHRHRYEFNNEYKNQYEMAGMVFSGTSPDKKLVEVIELKNHPFFVGTQFHPEYISQPMKPHPLFLSFVKATKKARLDKAG